MRQAALALNLYANDNDGYLPSSALVNGSAKWNRDDFIRFATKTGKCSPTKARTTYAEAICDYATSRDVFLCPSDPLGSQASAAGTEASYYWKLAVDKAWYGEDCTKPYRKTGDYPHAAHAIILYERKDFHNTGMPLKRGTMINVAYMDAHVVFTSLINTTTGDPVNCAANADGEPMYFNYDYKAQKGLTSDKSPAKWVDPGRYGDRL